MANEKIRELSPHQKAARDKVQKFKRALLEASKKSGLAHSGSKSPNKVYGKKVQEVERLPREQPNKNQDMEKMPNEQQNVNQDMEMEDLEWLKNHYEGEGNVSEDSNNPQPTNTRGPTKLNQLDPKSSKKLVVDFNEKGLPIGPNSNLYSSYLGKVARDRAPISYPTWHKVTPEIKDKMWTVIQQHFVAPERARKQTFKSIGKLWRGFKTKLRKRIYDAYDTDQDRIANCPTDIKLPDWKEFVTNCSCDGYKKLRENGKKAVQHHKMPHTCSRKGYARLEDELRRKKGKIGKPITRGTVWVAGHKRKNGEPINEFAKEKIDKLKEIDCDIECGRGDALSQVLGPDPNGRARGVGYGVTPSTLYGVQQCYGRMSEL